MFRASLLMVAGLVLAGCNPFFLEAEATSVCQHLSNQHFQVPSDVRAQVALLPPEMQRGVAVSRTFDFDVSAQLPPELQEMVDMRFALTSVKITAVEGSTDLGFVDEAHLSLAPAASSGLEARQFDYLRTETAPRIVSWNGDAFDVAAYLESGSLRYVVSLVGTLPTGDVTVDVDACAEAALRLDYL